MSRRLISQLAHVEVFTPEPEQSLRFYKDVVGLYESDREGQSVYLRGWGAWFHHGLKLTEAPRPGLGHIGWRAAGEEELGIAVSNVEETGLGEGWYDGSLGHGPAYRFRGPGGHLHELFWEVERYVAPPELRSPYPNRPQRFTGHGVAPRQLDHVTVMTKDVLGDAAWYRDILGFRFMEWTVLDEERDFPVFATLTNVEKSHDLGLIFDQTDVPGRLHHVAWWVDSRDELLRAADILLNAGVTLEFGPGRHGIGEQDYVYLREPGGARVEFNTGGYRQYEPDWETVRWTPAQGSNTFYRNVPMPQSMMEATPPVGGGEGEINPWEAASVS